MIFTLHPKLQEDCIIVGRLELCLLLLMNDSQFPWFILVPERAEIKEIYQLSSTERGLLIEESSRLSLALMDIFKGEKINIAAIGNMVPQLHIHHVVRYQSDKAWPSPVWGKFSTVPYTDEQLTFNLSIIKSRLACVSKGIGLVPS